MPQVDDSRFVGNLRARLYYARIRPVQEAIEAFRTALANGEWKEAPDVWLNQLHGFVYMQNRERVGLAPLRAALVDAIVAGPLALAARDVLTTLFAPELALTPAEADRLADWFTASATAGDASVAADTCDRLSRDSRPEIAKARRSLVNWLLRNGASELRSQRRTSLLRPMAQMFLEEADNQDLLVAVMRYVVRHEATLGLHWGQPDVFLRAAEVLQDRWPGLVADLLAAGRNDFGPYLLRYIFESTTVREHTRQTAVDALIRGELPTALRAAAWEFALTRYVPPPPDTTIRFCFGDDAVAAIEALRQVAVEYSPRDDRTSSELAPSNLRRWADFIAGEIIRIFGVHFEPPHAAALDRLLVQEAVSGGVGDALLRAVIADARSETALAREILEEGVTAFHVGAALSVLRTVARPATTTTGPAADVEVFRHVLESIVTYPWLEPHAGVDIARLLGRAKRVAFENLTNDDKIVVDGETVRLDRTALGGCLDARFSADEQQALAALYLVHELVHVGQGMGDKANVARLRSTGAESTLMHVDLAADHAAAMLVTLAVPRWSSMWLKDLAGRSLALYPAGRSHTAASRARKAQRLVGLRVDYLLRLHDGAVAARLGDGYAFADFGPAGGDVLFLASGPPMSLLGVGPLAAKQATLLGSAADDGAAGRLAAVDETLGQIMKNLA